MELLQKCSGKNPSAALYNQTLGCALTDWADLKLLELGLFFFTSDGSVSIPSVFLQFPGQCSRPFRPFQMHKSSDCGHELLLFKKKKNMFQSQSKKQRL